jgi:hypothetical protein
MMTAVVSSTSRTMTRDVGRPAGAGHEDGRAAEKRCDIPPAHGREEMDLFVESLQLGGAELPRRHVRRRPIPGAREIQARHDEQASGDDDCRTDSRDRVRHEPREVGNIPITTSPAPVSSRSRWRICLLNRVARRRTSSMTSR